MTAKSTMRTALLAAALLASAVATGNATDAGLDVYADTASIEHAGFRVLDFLRGDVPTKEALTIEREMIPAFTKKLGDTPGFFYAFADFEGNGNHDLFLSIRHIQVCQITDCPTHVYRFDGKTWKELFAINASIMAIKPPRKRGDQPELAVIHDPNQYGDPTITEYFRFERGKLVGFTPKKPNKQQPPRP